MQRILYMIRKEFRQIFRDPPMVAIIFMVPLFQLLILANAITTEVKHIKLTIVRWPWLFRRISRRIYSGI